MGCEATYGELRSWQEKLKNGRVFVSIIIRQMEFSACGDSIYTYIIWLIYTYKWVFIFKAILKGDTRVIWIVKNGPLVTKGWEPPILHDPTSTRITISIWDHFDLGRGKHMVYCLNLIAFSEKKIPWIFLDSAWRFEVFQKFGGPQCLPPASYAYEHYITMELHWLSHVLFLSST